MSVRHDVAQNGVHSMWTV